MREIYTEKKKNLLVQDIIDQLATRQTKILTEQKKWKPNDKRIEKQRKALRKELEVVANAIIEKAISTLDSNRTLRYYIIFIVGSIVLILITQILCVYCK